jgi:tRNA G10  N-methylase Trm11
MGLEKWLKIKTRENVLETLESVVSNKKVTFADNMDEPVHRWFRFPAGFSAELVRETIRVFKIDKSSIILDPFTGSGTTNVVAESLGINSIGVELHPLLAWVARVKTYWAFDLSALKSEIEKLFNKLDHEINSRADRLIKDVHLKPELLLKCYPPRTLAELYAIKEIVEEIPDQHLRDFFLLALLSTLRDATDVDVGWPYVLPRKRKKKALPPLIAFKQRVRMQYDDLVEVRSKLGEKIPETIIYEEDARRLTRILDRNSIDFVFTSPPYLNNYDYADRTRLELYFLGWALSWREISEKIRKKLIVSCAHQAAELGLPEGLMPSDEIEESVREELIEKSRLLNRIKYTRGGKKDYDIMVVAYFNDMVKAMKEIYEVMKDRAYFAMVVGDSAPYGVYIPTDEYLGKIGVGIGFKWYKIYVIRRRGHKWSYLVEKGRRHGIPLKESLVLFQK